MPVGIGTQAINEVKVELGFFTFRKENPVLNSGRVSFFIYSV